MNILHVHSRMRIGGAERALYQLIRAQRLYGINADLLISSPPEHYAQKCEELGAKVHFMSRRTGLAYSGWKKFRELVSCYHAIHFHSPNPTLVFLASQFKTQGLFYTHRGGPQRLPLKRLLSYKFCGYFFRRHFLTSGNTCAGASAAAELFRIAPSQVHVTYNGIDFSLLNPRRSRQSVLHELGENADKTVRIGTSAHVRNWKRINFLLTAVAKLSRPDIRCYIIGDGPDRPRLEKLSHQLGIANIVRFLGMKKEIGDFLQILDIFTLTSNSTESFGNSAVEAMGMGIPTIVMRDGGGLVEHITDDGGFIVDDVDELVSRLQQLIESPDLRFQMGNVGRDFVRNRYTLENMCRSYDTLYKATSLPQATERVEQSVHGL
jgi:glycosyltransferase involved in cell wall biosynthesis